MEKIWPTAPYNYSASCWTNNFSISLLENHEPPHVHDFGIFGGVNDSQNQYHLALETPRYFKQPETNPNLFLKDMIWENLKSSVIKHFEKWERRTPTNPGDPL